MINGCHGAAHTFDIVHSPQSSHISQCYIVANTNVSHGEGVVGREVGTEVGKGHQLRVVGNGQLSSIVGQVL